jgi:hypothetical protein
MIGSTAIRTFTIVSGGQGRDATNSTAAVEYEDPSIANKTFTARRSDTPSAGKMK